jgi:hypothetical protein
VASIAGAWALWREAGNDVAEAMGRLAVYEVRTGVYGIAPTGRRVAGSLVARVGGGYDITLGDTTGTGLLVSTANGAIVI